MTRRHMRWGPPPGAGGGGRFASFGGGGGMGGSGGTGGIGTMGGFVLTPWVKWLLLANLVVHLLTAIGLPPRGFAVEWFGYNASQLLTRPWSPLTYMFLHGDFGHLFMNMLVLFFFGPQLERHWGSSFFIKYYVVAGLGGALIALALFPLFGTATVIGASGAVFGLLLAFALQWPNAPIYLYFVLPVKAKWFVGVLGVFTLFATFTGSSGNVAHWAHLGGLITGFLYLRLGDRIGSGVSKLVRNERKKKADVKVERATSAPRKPPRRRTRNGVNGDALDEVDRILDKIRASGMDSLTSEEREFLDEMSRKYQNAP